MVAERLVWLAAWSLVLVDWLSTPLGLGALSAASAGLLWLCWRRKTSSVGDRWKRLVRKLRRVRKQQRYFAWLGFHLRTHVNPNVLKRLKKVWQDKEE